MLREMYQRAHDVDRLSLLLLRMHVDRKAKPCSSVNTTLLSFVLSRELMSLHLAEVLATFQLQLLLNISSRRFLQERMDFLI